MEFHETDATKALGSAGAVVEAGKIVLSKEKGRSFIENNKTGEKIYLRRGVGAYVFDVEFEDEDDDEDDDVEMSPALPFSRRG